MFLLLGLIYSCNTNGSTETEVAFDPASYTGENEFVIYALETIEGGDFYEIDGLRDVIQTEDLAEFVATYNSNYSDGIKNEYVNVLMDQNGPVVEPIMKDALNSSSFDVKATAIAILTGHPDIYSVLYDDSGWVIESKVDSAVAHYKSSN